MKKLKKKIALALVLTMATGLMSVPSWAEEAPKRIWQLEEDGWHYYNDKGEEQKGRVKMIHDTWYAFKEDGVMFSNTLCADLRKKDDGTYRDDTKYYYAFSDGHLAEGWVKLNDDGKFFTNKDGEEQIHWYYFKADDEPNEEERYAGFRMLRGVEEYIGNEGKTYRFKDDGNMYSAEWYYMKDGAASDSPDDGTATYYYQMDGAKAVDKWLPVDEYWYYFGEDGSVASAAPVASDSDAEPAMDLKALNIELTNAPYPVVEEISVKEGNEEVKATVGEPVELKFQVKVASDSDASSPDFNMRDHDWWGTRTASGRFKSAKYNWETETCTVKYIPKQLEEETVSIFIDGVESDSVTIIPKTETSEQKEKAVEAIIDTLLTSGTEGSGTATEARESILNLYQDVKSEEKQGLANAKGYANLENTYVMENNVNVKPVNVAEDAQELLKNGSVSVIGGGLNAEEGQAVELKVAAEKAPALTGEYAKQVVKATFDIKMEVDGENKTDLDFPVKISMPVPEGVNVESMSLIHIHNGEENKIDYTLSEDKTTIQFVTTGFSTFVFVQKDDEPDKPNVPGDDDNNSSNNNKDDDDDSYDSKSSSKASGTISTDSKKGRVNSLTGIVTGSGDGYSKWIQESGTDTKWKLQYADGTCATGAYAVDAQGNPLKDNNGNPMVQPAWEMINGVWYAFGEDSYAKSGMIFDPALDGWFYIEINTGMKTGWQQIDGKWYYFNTVSNGKKGIMYVNQTTPDGYAVGADGVWNK